MLKTDMRYKLAAESMSSMATADAQYDDLQVRVCEASNDSQSHASQLWRSSLNARSQKQQAKDASC